MCAGAGLLAGGVIPWSPYSAGQCVPAAPLLTARGVGRCLVSSGVYAGVFNKGACMV